MKIIYIIPAILLFLFTSCDSSQKETSSQTNKIKYKSLDFKEKYLAQSFIHPLGKFEGIIQ